MSFDASEGRGRGSSPAQIVAGNSNKPLADAVGASRAVQVALAASDVPPVSAASIAPAVAAPPAA